MELNVSLFPNARTAVGRQEKLSWDELYNKYLSMHDFRNSKDGQLFSFAEYPPNKAQRKNENVIRMHGMILDFDRNSITINEVSKVLRGLKYSIYSTYSNSKEHVKFRVVVPFNYPCSSSKYLSIWKFFAFEKFGDDDKKNKDGTHVDIACKDLARISYLPSCNFEDEDDSFSTSVEGTLFKIETIKEEDIKEKEKPKPKSVRSLQPRERIENSVTDNDKIVSALSYISPDCEYQDWLAVGMGIHNMLGEDGLFVWDTWSSNSSKYKGIEELQAKWNGFSAGGGTTENTFFKMARLAGYREVDLDWSLRAEEFSMDKFMEKASLDKEDAEESEDDTEFGPDGFPTELLQAPGLLGKITDWITETSIKPQPVLSLAAAIPAIGVLMGHRFATLTDLRTNMYVVAIAPSGAGKDHPRKCINKLFQLAECWELIGGSDPSSGAAMFDHLYENHGRRLSLMDEFGKTLQSMKSSNASTHQASVAAMMTKLSTSASDRFMDIDRRIMTKGSDKEKTRYIEQPCMCILGTATPDQFYDAMKSADVLDGFLNRWLVMQIDDHKPEKRKFDRAFMEKCDFVPDDIVLELQRINAAPTNPHRDDILNRDKIRPMRVFNSDKAQDIFDTVGEQVEEQADICRREGTGIEVMWNRVMEASYKLALIASVGKEQAGKDLEVGGAEAMWATSFVVFCTKRLIKELRKNMSENRHEEEVKKVFRIVDKFRDNDGWIPLRGKFGVKSKCQWVSNESRIMDILSMLIESGHIVSDSRLSPTGKTRHICYKAL
tara:strand:+ start:6731 stop:9058 length:2328 start_codon:yes stop_codon:yes gene_type:complete